MLALAAAGLLALGAPGDNAAAAYGRSALVLALHYEMTCGQPGPGPLLLQLPRRFRLSGSRALVDGALRNRTVAGSDVTIELPKPPAITCMSIAEGILRVRLTGVLAPRGTWTIRATLPRHSFVTRLHVG